MALTDFKTQFDNSYQTIFDKVLVALKVTNLRFEPVLKYGEAVTRMLPSVSSVRVRTVTRGAASTIDTISDSTETLTVNIEKEAAFYISDGEVKQDGPLNPGEYFGGHIAQKVAADLDGRIFSEVLNASQDFDDGDLTTLASTGTPITLSSTTVPQLVSRMPAKLTRGTNQVLANMVLVIDSYSAADIAQYLLGKQFDIVESVFKNGYSGDISTAQVYVSENLTGEVVLTMTTLIDGTDTFTLNGVTLQLTSGTPSVAGDISAAATATPTEIIANIAVALNDPYNSSDGVYVAVSDANAALLTGGAGLSCDAVAGVLTIRAVGGGRMVVTEDISGGSFNSPFIHSYYGKRGGIDVVVQDLSPVDMRQTSDRRGTNVFSSYLAGKRTFTDGSRRFLDVHILA